MNRHTNAFQSPASTRTGITTVTYLGAARTRTPAFASNRGEVIMSRIQKAAAAAIALMITLAGAAFVSAPMALADMRMPTFHQVVSAPQAQLARHPSVAASSRHG